MAFDVAGNLVMIVKFTFQSVFGNSRQSPRHANARCREESLELYPILWSDWPTTRISFYSSSSQTLFFGGREATTGNTSAVRRLGWDRKLRYCPLFGNRLLGIRVIRREQNSRWTLTRAKTSFISGVKTGSMLVCRPCDCTSGNLNKTSVKRKVLVPVPENPISAHPGLKIYLPMHCLE